MSKEYAPPHDDTRRPTVAVVGVGAIGTVVADALTGRADVVLVRRDSHDGMSIADDSGLHRVDARVAASADEVSVVDWVVLATKAQDVNSTALWLQALIGPSTKVAIMQNGISQAERVAHWVPAERVVPAVVLVSAEKTGLNTVTVRQRNRVVLPDTVLAAELRDLLGDRLEVSLADDFQSQAWRKLVMNAALSSVTALTSRNVEVAKEMNGRELISSVLNEGIEVGRAQGLLHARDDEFMRMRDQIESLPSGASTSMQLDRQRGSSLEYQFLTGAVVDVARQLNVPVPATQALHDLLSLLDRGAQ